MGKSTEEFVNEICKTHKIIGIGWSRDDAEKMRLKNELLETDSQRKLLLDEIKQSHSTHKLEEEYLNELESDLESKREEIVELKKQTQQIRQKVAEQEKQITEDTNLSLSSLEMLEEQKAGILEEITQEQAKKQSQEDELQALTKEWLHQKSSNKNRQGIDEQIKKHRDNLHTIQNKCSMLELEIKSQMNLLDEERQKEKKIIMRITQKYN
jgi:chromosome segregation ATPase